LALLAGVVFIRRKRAYRVFLVAAFLLYAVAGNPWVSGWLVKSLEWRYLTEGEIPEADTIVALSGGIEAKTYPRQTIEVGGAADRVLYAGWLFRRKKAPLIIVTGGIVPGSTRERSHAEDMRAVLEMVGIPPEAVIMEKNARNTYEHARECKKIFEKMDLRKILLVTSALHMPRAVGVFQKAGVDVVPAPTDFSVTRKEGKTPLLRSIFGLIPTAANLLATRAAMHEYIGLAYYRVRGWI
jgi:uncharacterized SAM-binding protein YcdF (DUF218 family)